MGNKNTTRLINKTDEVLEIREFRGIITDENNVFSRITVNVGQHKDIDPTKYDGADSQGGQLPSVMIFCDGRSLLNSSGYLLLPGDEFFGFNFITVTIGQSPEDQKSAGVVNYEVKLEPPRDSSVKAKTLKAMTLDPSKLFASIDNPETSLLCMVLKFWPRTFTDLNCKDDLVKTVGVVNDLMVQGKEYNADRSKVEYNADRLKGEYNADRLEGKVAKVMEKVSVLNKLCAAKVEWYRPLFPGMEKKFPPVAEPMGKVDQEKLQNFTTTIAPLLKQRNSLPETSS